MKKIFSMLLALFFLLTTFGCGNKSSNDANSANNKKFKVAYISDTYGQEDVKNKQVIDGINEAFQNYEFSFDIEIPKASDKYESVSNGLLSSASYDLVISNSHAVSSSLVSISKNYPSTNLGFIGYEDTTNSGMSIKFKSEEGAFLAGVLAAKSTKTNSVGYIGAYNNRNKEYEYGFKAGVKAVDEKISVKTAFTNSYIDSSAGAKAAKSLAEEDNADVFFTVCGAGAIGVGSVIKEKGLKIIDSDLYNTSDNDIKLGEIYKDYKSATTTICESVIFDSFKPNVNYLGVGDSVVDLKLNPNIFAKGDTVTSEIEKFKKNISTSAIVVPKDSKSLDAFKYNNKQ